MKNLHLNVASFIFLLALAACDLPPKVYYNRGDPENLIDVSSEVVTIALTSPNSLTELSNMVSQDPPTRAILNCPQGDALCGQAKNICDKHGIASQWAGNGSNTAKAGVTLIYERVTARDCQNRYIDDTGTPGNLPPPTFGCSITGNMVQMTSDKRQFVTPGLLDFQDGEKAAQAYGRYLQPPPPLSPPPYYPPPPDSPMAIYPGAVATDK